MFQRYWQKIVRSIHPGMLRDCQGRKRLFCFVYAFCYRAFGQKVMLPPHTETLSRAGYLHTGIVDLYRLRYMGLSRYFDDLKLGCIEFVTIRSASNCWLLVFERGIAAHSGKGGLLFRPCGKTVAHGFVDLQCSWVM